MFMLPGTDNTSGNSDIFFAASNDNGTSFSTPINLSNNTGLSLTLPPQIAAIRQQCLCYMAR